MGGKEAKRKGQAGRKALTLVYSLGLALSIGYLVYLNVSDWLAQYEAESNITRIQNLYPDENDPERLEYKRQAIMYNEMVAGKRDGEGVLSYHEQLYYKQEPMISYIEISKIAIKLPIYHGTEENALMAGVGHLEGSSLPVGGIPSRCVLTGHSGMPNTRMFDDLGKLEVGDTFVIWTLGDPYAYEIVETQVVLPEEAMKLLEITPGKDMVTLVTCTPYGINSHRLLVHAERCEYKADEQPPVTVDAYLNMRTIPLLIGLGILLLVLVVTIRRITKKRREKRDGKNQRT